MGESQAQEAHLWGFESIHPEFCAAVVDAFRSALDEARHVGKSEEHAMSLEYILLRGVFDRENRHRAVIVHDGQHLDMASGAQQYAQILEKLQERKRQMNN